MRVKTTALVAVVCCLALGGCVQSGPGGQPPDQTDEPTQYSGGYESDADKLLTLINEVDGKATVDVRVEVNGSTVTDETYQLDDDRGSDIVKLPVGADVRITTEYNGRTQTFAETVRADASMYQLFVQERKIRFAVLYYG